MRGDAQSRLRSRSLRKAFPVEQFMQSASDSVNSPAAVGVDLIDFFDVTPTSLWLEDYSDLYRLFAQWRTAGVTHHRRFVEQHSAPVAAS